MVFRELKYILKQLRYLEVEWKDESTSWIKLKEIKETNPFEVANYAISIQIDDEPAFDWWVKDILKKQKHFN
jgi:hypothetical protein